MIVLRYRSKGYTVYYRQSLKLIITRYVLKICKTYKAWCIQYCIFQLNDVEKKQAHGQLIYADIGNSVAQYTAPVSAMSYPSLSLQLDDSQVQYADINPQQSTANHNSNMKVDTEAGTYPAHSVWIAWVVWSMHRRDQVWSNIFNIWQHCLSLDTKVDQIKF